MMMIKFVVLTLVVVISPKSINAGKELMVRECHNAQVPTICMQCLESDPSSVHADRFGIANIVIHCLQSRLDIITNNITNLSSQIQESEVKAVLNSCKTALSRNATTELVQAKAGLKTRNYDKAGQALKLALGFPVFCEIELLSLKFESVELFNQIAIYAQLCDAAMRITDRF